MIKNLIGIIKIYLKMYDKNWHFAFEKKNLNHQRTP